MILPEPSTLIWCVTNPDPMWFRNSTRASEQHFASIPERVLPICAGTLSTSVRRSMGCVGRLRRIPRTRETMMISPSWKILLPTLSCPTPRARIPSLSLVQDKTLQGLLTLLGISLPPLAPMQAMPQRPMSPHTTPQPTQNRGLYLRQHHTDQ